MVHDHEEGETLTLLPCSSRNCVTLRILPEGPALETCHLDGPGTSAKQGDTADLGDGDDGDDDMDDDDDDD